MEPYPYLQENLRDPVKFVPPVPSPRPSRPAFELWMQAKADPMVLQLLPAIPPAH